MTTTKRRKFSPDFKLQVCNLVSQGTLVRTVACTYDLTTGQIYRWLKEHPVLVPSKQLSLPFSTSDKEAEYIKSLHSEIKGLKKVVSTQARHISSHSILRGSLC